mmetsp:Transcript_4649/g.11729  ORF Transcript_4649/g.11729 Transcript_4649/m.11729 type:complete len:205 (-) Transcript_4649:173-787(-)
MRELSNSGAHCSNHSTAALLAKLLCLSSPAAPTIMRLSSLRYRPALGPIGSCPPSFITEAMLLVKSSLVSFLRLSNSFSSTSTRSITVDDIPTFFHLFIIVLSALLHHRHVLLGGTPSSYPNCGGRGGVCQCPSSSSPRARVFARFAVLVCDLSRSGIVLLEEARWCGRANRREGGIIYIESCCAVVPTGGRFGPAAVSGHRGR